MPEPVLRIFSYLPNPRVWKATITARLCGVEVEVRGARPPELAGWLWDFDARPLSELERRSDSGNERQGRTGFQGALHKTDAFLRAHPFGTVPAAFSPDGEVGIFESNSIMRAVARLGPGGGRVYGSGPYEASRIDGFLDASLVFARDAQGYLLALGAGELTPSLHEATARSFDVYLTGIEQALEPDRRFLVGEQITLADVCYLAEIALFSAERARPALRGLGLAPILDGQARYPAALAHFQRLVKHPACAPDAAPYLEKLERAVAKHAVAP